MRNGKAGQNQAVAIVEPQAPTMQMSELSPKDVSRQVQLIQQVMEETMSDGEHFGVIPGTHKPTLYKAGAEKLLLTFRLAPTYEEVSAIEADELMSYRIRCNLSHITTGDFVGSGLGACNSKERKYKTRDPWDMQNTIYKMACKRALVAAVLNATAASDCFTQDLEDMPADTIAQPKQRAAAASPAAAQNGTPRCITEPQRKRLFAISKQSNVSEAAIKTYLVENYGIDSTAKITMDDYTSICEWVQSQVPPQPSDADESWMKDEETAV